MGNKTNGNERGRQPASEVLPRFIQSYCLSTASLEKTKAVPYKVRHPTKLIPISKYVMILNILCLCYSFQTNILTSGNGLLTSSSRNNDASRKQIDGSGGRGGAGEGSGDGGGVLRWRTVLMVPMRLGDVW